MAVSIEDIKKLRHMTGAGMMDCKNALAETNGDIDAAIATLKCETDFVAKNESFRALAKRILDAALAAKAKSLDELKNLSLDGRTVAELITDEVGKTGEKMELGDYEWIEAASVAAYNHFNDKLAAIVGFNLEGVDPAVGREVCMQIASMNPVAVSRDNVAKETIDQEISVAVEKTKAELIRKAQDSALSKAGLNPNHFDSEDHIESNISKGWISEEDAARGRQIMKEAGEAKAANLPEQMIQNIANGRLNKFFKENCLMEQEYVQNAKITVAQFLDETEKGLVVVDFKRVNLNQD